LKKDNGNDFVIKLKCRRNRNREAAMAVLYSRHFFFSIAYASSIVRLQILLLAIGRDLEEGAGFSIATPSASY